MGKKRRLRSAQAKFGVKHSAHPRMVLIAESAIPPVVIEEKPKVPTVELVVKKPVEAPATLPVTPTAPAVLPTIAAPVAKEEAIIAKPKAAAPKRPSPAKKSKRSTRRTEKTRKKTAAPVVI